MIELNCTHQYMYLCVVTGTKTVRFIWVKWTEVKTDREREEGGEEGERERGRKEKRREGRKR